MGTDRIGERYGRLLVTKKAPSKHGYARWWCLCDCGKTKNVSGTCLQQGRIKSCGCLRRETATQRAAINSKSNELAAGEAACNLLYAVYRHNAEIRSRDFSITKEQFRELTSSNCFYCNLIPTGVYKASSKTGVYIYNGIDRKQNEVGYVIENCVPCCKTCNWMKRMQTQAEFLDACRRVVDWTNHKKSAEMPDSAV